MSRKNLKIAQDERGERVFSLDLKKIKRIKNAHKEFLPQRKMEVIKKERKRCSRVTSPPHTYYTQYKFGIVLFIKSNGNLQFEQKTTVRTSGKKEFNCC